MYPRNPAGSRLRSADATIRHPSLSSRYVGVKAHRISAGVPTQRSIVQLAHRSHLAVENRTRNGMSVYVRNDSPYYWMLLERPRQKPIYESTKIPVASNSPELRKQQKHDAHDVYASRMAALARSRHELPAHDPTTVDFKTFASWFDRHHIARHRGAERDRASLKHLIGFFGSRDLSAIDRPRVSEYMTARAKKVRPGTVNREVDLLKSMLVAAVPKYLKASPIAGMRRLRVVKRRKRILTPAEESRLLKQLDPADRALYIVAVDTLMRLSNVLNLKRSEYDGSTISLEDSKTGPYVIPVSTRARAELDALPKSGEYFFPHRRSAKTDRDRRSVVRRLLQRACSKTSPPVPYGRASAGITFHIATRATGATRMLQRGVDAKTVQRIGNWKSLEQMGEYLETDLERMQAAVDQIGKGITPRLRAKPAKLRMAKVIRKKRAS